MAIYRNVHINFWTDSKVADDFTPEDRYFMLFCLTNQYTNLCGCYEISIKQMSEDLGYDKDTVEKLLDRFKNVHKILDYDRDTKELFIKNWYKYNWNSSEKIEKAIIESIKGVKSLKLKEELAEIYNSRDRVSIPYTYTMDTSDTDTVYYTDTDTDTVSVSVTDTVTDVINYLNSKIGTKFRTNNKVTIKHIGARMREGFKPDDFITVINKKVLEWKDTEYAKYLRPETLFGTKFEGYLNQKSKQVTTKDLVNNNVVDFSMFENKKEIEIHE